MGLGIVIKLLLQGSFSLMVFGWTQIIMDLQPLFVLISGEGHLHGFSHTYVGASLLAVFSAVTGKHLSEWGLRYLGIPGYSAIQIAWWVVFASAFIGSFSHVALDSLMHPDIQPLFPFLDTNALLGIISISTLYKICIYSGLIGGVLYLGTRAVLAKKPFVGN